MTAALRLGNDPLESPPDVRLFPWHRGFFSTSYRLTAQSVKISPQLNRAHLAICATKNKQFIECNPRFFRVYCQLREAGVACTNKAREELNMQSTRGCKIDRKCNSGEMAYPTAIKPEKGSRRVLLVMAEPPSGKTLSTTLCGKADNRMHEYTEIGFEILRGALFQQSGRPQTSRRFSFGIARSSSLLAYSSYRLRAQVWRY